MMIALLSTFLYLSEPIENRVRIAVVDSGLKTNYFSEKAICKDGHVDFTGDGLNDEMGHGTNVAGLIANRIDVSKQCITIMKVFTLDDNKNKLYRSTSQTSWVVQAIIKSIKLNVKYINLSFGGNTPMLPEKMVIKLALLRDIRVLVAMGNEGKDFDQVKCDYFPACYDFGGFSNWFTVSNRINEQTYHSLSNRRGPEKYGFTGVNQSAWGVIMTGTSQATANLTGWLARSEDMK